MIGLGELSEEDQDAQRTSVLDPEAQAVMEMMGKTFHSKVIREVDDQEEEKKKRQEEGRAASSNN